MRGGGGGGGGEGRVKPRSWNLVTTLLQLGRNPNPIKVVTEFEIDRINLAVVEFSFCFVSIIPAASAKLGNTRLRLLRLRLLRLHSLSGCGHYEPDLFL